MPQNSVRPRSGHGVRRAARAGDTVIASNDVVVERWEREPLLQRVEQHLAVRVGPAIAVGSVNVDHFTHFGRGRIELHNDPERTGVDWVMLADGAPVALRAKMVTGREWPRLTGADLLPDLLGCAAKTDSVIGFLGGRPQVHDRLREVLAQSFPQLPEPRFWAPDRDVVDSSVGSLRIADEIRDAGVDLLAVALGKPRQEMWIQRFGALTEARVLLAFGASADFLAGEVDRAPEWMQGRGLEWAYRLRKEPRRLARRYLLEGPPAVARLIPAREVESAL
ncbi:MAG: WecB/TagA/CpsF family glycosyltransferase [Micrococcales bacterium]|nr:WecB/TagA/CpsF family glycosyltransferase [Micrococcales bacterium]